ncbi:MAG: tRNA uridine-5-carboxymethylaminomethyl(34) synthesis GTPase MnmE [Spirochaetaceae bacterium]|nr:tRNA uridine-5-carboxymethylaminomethyl(34) synthesis GTPase MnmE [Spirochaetaceae bacterium]
MDNTGYSPEEPMAAIATALAPAALGIIRVSGKKSIELVANVFSRPKALLNASGNTIVYGWIFDPSSTKNQPIDEVLINVFREPKSFTGEDMVEINCHGGPAVVKEIYNLLLQNGFRPANPGEFTFRAFINGKADLTKAEAVYEIIEAKTDVSVGRAAGRLAGNLFQLISEIKKKLVNVLASIEAEIEYPEDEETIADAFDDFQLRQVQQELKELCNSWSNEKLYQDGAKIVLCGKTNAGKSSLFNTLLKEERAIVSDIHGTTRDWIESWVSFGGIPARLFDTAGLRETEDTIEQSGVCRTMDLTQEADLILYVVDATLGLTQEDKNFLQDFSCPKSVAENISKKTPIVLVFNKCDLSKNVASEIQKELETLCFSIEQIVELSAKTGKGTAKLNQIIYNQLISSTKKEREIPGLGSARQKQAAQAALESVEHGIKAAKEGYPLDAVVQDIEDALDCLGEITGVVTPEDILDTVFSKFCLGK